MTLSSLSILALRSTVLAAVGLSSMGTALAGPAHLAPLQGHERGIHVRAGVSIRSIGVDFQMRPMTTNVPGLAGSSTSGLGDVGPYQGGNTPVTYDNRAAGVEIGLNTGIASTTIDGASQVSPVDRTGEGFYQVEQVTFSSSETTTTGTVLGGTGSGVNVSDEEISVGPYFELVIPLWSCEEETIHDGKKVVVTEEEKCFLNGVVGYSYHSASQGTGRQFVGQVSSTQTVTTFDYTYDFVYATTSGSQVGMQNPAGGPFPFTADGLIYDASQVAASLQIPDIAEAPEVEDPRRTENSVVTTTALDVYMQSDLDVDLHELPLGLEWGCYFGKDKRSSVALTGGATINFVDADLTTRTQYFTPGASSPLATRTSRGGDSEVAWGAYAGVNFTRFLNEMKTWYVKAHTSYRWVEDVNLSLGGTQAKIDLSSLEGGIGLGVIF